MVQAPSLYDQWAEDTEIITLPSGRQAKLRRPDIINLITAEGDVPNILASMALAGVQTGQTAIAVNDIEKLREVAKSLDLICMAAFVDPPLSTDEQCTAPYIPLSRVPFHDKGHIFAWALGAKYEAVSSFRPQPAQHVAGVPSRNHVQGKAKRQVAAKR